MKNRVKGEYVWSGWSGVSAVNTTTRALDQHLADLNSFWSYNESDLSKYEDFDHSRFLGQSNDFRYFTYYDKPIGH